MVGHHSDAGIMSIQTMYDVLVIGGGITGAAAARDAALRGLSVALLEKGDFAGGTSSRSTKMLHGGLRYLEHFDFMLVREALHEREIMKNLAPHQVERVRFLLPVYKGDRFCPFKLKLGMVLYDRLRPRGAEEHYKVLNPGEALEKEKYLKPDGLLGAAWYYEYNMLSPERFVLSMIQSAERQGAHVANYRRVIGVLREGEKVVGVQSEDVFSGKKEELFARVIINTAGPWVDEVLGLAARDIPRRVRTTKGIHLFVPKISDHAVMFAANRDGRLIFGIPWQNYTNIGSTDTDFTGNPDEIHAEKEEVDYLLAELKNVLKHPGIDRSNILFTYAGVRPLAFEEGKSESEVSRKHIIYPGDNDKEGGILSVTGGKLTIARLMGEQLIDIACKRLGRRERSTTKENPLPGGAFGSDVSVPEFTERAIKKYTEQYPVSGESVRQLIISYGTEIDTVLEFAAAIPDGFSLIRSDSPEIRAQVAYAVRYERAKTLLDVVLRRTNIAVGPALRIEALENIADILARELHWDADKRKQEMELYLRDRESREQY